MTVNEVIATIKDHRGGEIPADTDLPDELLVLEIERLEEALATLVDIQKSPPMLCWVQGWREARAVANELLGRGEPTEGPS